MRLLFAVAAFALFASLQLAPSSAYAQGCSGPECAQQGGGHQCEREKKEEATS